MENVAKASNLQFKPSMIPRQPGQTAAAAKQPSPKEQSETKGSLYAASGAGLRLCAPKSATSFLVECTSPHLADRRKLKVCCCPCTCRRGVFTVVKQGVQTAQNLVSNSFMLSGLLSSVKFTHAVFAAC